MPEEFEKDLGAPAADLEDEETPIDPDLMLDTEDDAVLDEDEVDPFKDKWEE